MDGGGRRRRPQTAARAVLLPEAAGRKGRIHSADSSNQDAPNAIDAVVVVDDDGTVAAVAGRCSEWRYGWEADAGVYVMGT